MAITRLGPNQDITAAKIAGQINFKNLIINGDMSVAQRGIQTGVTTNTYGEPDRWLTALNTLGTWTISQDTDVPTGQGFANSLKLDCTTADASPAAGDRIFLTQRLEGQMLQSLKKGTSNAESTTVSFWVKSNVTGTYILELFDNDNTRQVSKTYTIDSASTWEKKTITFDGDTTGTLDNDNNASLYVQWWLGAGTNWTSGTASGSWATNTNANRAAGLTANIGSDTANNFWITGAQLEADTSASDFEFLPYDVNLQRCYRYYEVLASGNGKTLGFGGAYNANTPAFASYLHPKRATPSIDQTSGTRYYRIYGNGVEYTWNAYSAFLQPTPTQVMFIGSGTIPQGLIGLFDTISGSSYIAYDAEL